MSKIHKAAINMAMEWLEGGQKADIVDIPEDIKQALEEQHLPHLDIQVMKVVGYVNMDGDQEVIRQAAGILAEIFAHTENPQPEIIIEGEEETDAEVIFVAEINDVLANIHYDEAYAILGDLHDKVPVD